MLNNHDILFFREIVGKYDDREEVFYSVGVAVGQGSAIGAAAGLTVGGVKGMDNSDVKYQIKEDLQSRSLQFRAIKKGELAYGFIFYPGEIIKAAKVLRLKLRASDTGQIVKFNMKLQ